MSDIAAGLPTAPVTNPTLFSHGTQEAIDFDKTGPFYEEFLGIGWHRQGRVAGGFASPEGEWYVAVISIPGQDISTKETRDYRWTLAMESADKVRDAHQKAQENKDKYDIREIEDIVEEEGYIGFCLQDLNFNWWEFEYRDGRYYDEFFKRGDVC